LRQRVRCPRFAGRLERFSRRFFCHLLWAPDRGAVSRLLTGPRYR